MRESRRARHTLTSSPLSSRLRPGGSESVPPPCRCRPPAAVRRSPPASGDQARCCSSPAGPRRTSPGSGTASGRTPRCSANRCGLRRPVRARACSGAARGAPGASRPTRDGVCRVAVEVDAVQDGAAPGVQRLGDVGGGLLLRQLQLDVQQRVSPGYEVRGLRPRLIAAHRGRPDDESRPARWTASARPVGGDGLGAAGRHDGRCQGPCRPRVGHLPVHRSHVRSCRR